MARTEKWVIDESTFPQKSPIEDKLLFLLKYGILAANTHNSQPWIFEIKKNKILITPDKTRVLKITDPKKRELWISLGCVLENILIAAQHFGLKGIESITRKGITISFKETKKRKNILFDQITKRKTNRRKPKRLIIQKEEILKLKKLPFEKTTKAYLIDQKEEIQEIAKLIYEANDILQKNNKYINETISWTRFNPTQVKKTMDGLSYKVLDIPPVSSKIGKFFMKLFLKSGYVNKEVKEKIKNSTGLIIITSQKDCFACWTRTGRTLQKILLLLTSFGIDYAFENQPCEVKKTREELKKMTKQYPQILLRIGHSKEIAHSERRNIKEVLKNEGHLEKQNK